MKWERKGWREPSLRAEKKHLCKEGLGFPISTIRCRSGHGERLRKNKNFPRKSREKEDLSTPTTRGNRSRKKKWWLLLFQLESRILRRGRRKRNNPRSQKRKIETIRIKTREGGGNRQSLLPIEERDNAPITCRKEENPDCHQELVLGRRSLGRKRTRGRNVQSSPGNACRGQGASIPADSRMGKTAIVAAQTDKVGLFSMQGVGGGGREKNRFAEARLLRERLESLPRRGREMQTTKKREPRL